MSQEIPFIPFPFMENPHVQTVCNGLVLLSPKPPCVQRLIALSDGDQISIEISTPSGWTADQPTVVLIHGLGGSSLSPNVVRMTHRLTALGIRAIRYNMRGCGSGKGLARRPYHSGRSDDLFEVLEKLKKESPQSPFFLIGFSLGGNIVLKLTGELGAAGGKFIQGAIAVSPPADLFSSIRLFLEPENRYMHRYFCKLLREEVLDRHQKFKDLPRVEIPRDINLYEFDQLYTAPQHGFESAEDYYSKCSSMHYVPDIGVPCRVLLSEDDPIICHTSLDGVDLPSHVELYKTKKGGHMGYLGHPANGRGFYWLDSLLVDWINELNS